MSAGVTRGSDTWIPCDGLGGLEPRVHLLGTLWTSADLSDSAGIAGVATPLPSLFHSQGME